jgi:hypothetical protein
MTALGIALIVIGVALVCAGFVFWHLASRTEPADDRVGGDGPGDLRALIDALQEQDQADRGAMSNVRPRLDEISDKNSLK